MYKIISSFNEDLKYILQNITATVTTTPILEQTALFNYTHHEELHFIIKNNK